MAMIKGIPVVLYDRTQTGVDDFLAPVYTETPVVVENVLVCPVSSVDTPTPLQLSGKALEYQLCIPKGDEHIWEDRVVEFWGCKWRTVGFATRLIESLVPLDWNCCIKVVRYG